MLALDQMSFAAPSVPRTGEDRMQPPITGFSDSDRTVLHRIPQTLGSPLDQLTARFYMRPPTFSNTSVMCGARQKKGVER